MSDTKKPQSQVKVLWLWHEPSNMMAIAECRSDLPHITICDDDFRGINPFYSYPLSFLGHYGWVLIGEI